MKNQLTRISIFIFIVLALANPSAIAQPGKNAQKKEKEQKQDNQKDKPHAGKPGKDKENQGNGKDGKSNQSSAHSNQNGNSNTKRNNEQDVEKGKNNKDKNGTDADYGYHWDNQNFKERNNIRKQEKVTICHKFGRTDEPPVTITVSANALKAHLDHGDVRGDCPAADNTRYSNSFLNRRKDYYNELQESQEQVTYSRSILDYALQRLSSSRLQLVNMQANNAPAADLDRKRATVTELEQNVSALEVLLGVAANLIANKWR
jgi:hypothetical protein